MDKKELRIGNYVKYNGSVVSVYAISNPTPSKDKHFNNKARVTLWCNGLMDATIDEIEPIPITEELVLKIGFKKDVDANNRYRYVIDNCMFEIRLWDSGTLIKLENYCEDCVRKVHLPKTPNLHQLQNAYYLLTGKELEIKL